MSIKAKRLALLVGGGPAPGINGVIRSVTIEAVNQGLQVYGCLDGFKYLCEGRTDCTQELTISAVSRIHYTGGSILRTSRAHPLEADGTLAKTLRTLKKLKISYLVTIGGDGTAFGAHTVSKSAQDWLRVVHVPKTIDNDIPLPGFRSTFGFHTARHYGAKIVEALMEDAKTSRRWFFVVSMGRQAGHLALGIGKAAGATLSVIGEEFLGKKIKFSRLCDVLEGAIIKRLAMGRAYGVALLAEGLADCVEENDLKKHTLVQRNKYGGLRFEEIELGTILRDEIRRRLARRKLELKVVAKNIGYELRCMPPIPFDAEYTQDLGHTSVRYLLGGGSGAVMSIKLGGGMDPIPFTDLLDEKSGRILTRHVDIHSDSYEVARSYMIRLEPKDFESAEWVKKLARAGKLSVKEFKRRFTATSQGQPG